MNIYQLKLMIVVQPFAALINIYSSKFSFCKFPLQIETHFVIWIYGYQMYLRLEFMAGLLLVIELDCYEFQ